MKRFVFAALVIGVVARFANGGVAADAVLAVLKPPVETALALTPIQRALARAAPWIASTEIWPRLPPAQSSRLSSHCWTPYGYASAKGAQLA
eukprot:1028170-Prymnesium_polylepis.1